MYFLQCRLILPDGLNDSKSLSAEVLAWCQIGDKPLSDQSLRHHMASLTNWGRATHICVGRLTIIGSDNGLSPGRRRAIIWTNAGILLIGPLGINLNEFLIEIYTFSFKKIHLKVSSGKWRPSCLGLNVLSHKEFILLAPVAMICVIIVNSVCFFWNFSVNIYIYTYIYNESNDAIHKLLINDTVYVPQIFK